MLERQACAGLPLRCTDADLQLGEGVLHAGTSGELPRLTVGRRVLDGPYHRPRPDRFLHGLRWEPEDLAASTDSDWLPRSFVSCMQLVRQRTCVWMLSALWASR